MANKATNIAFLLIVLSLSLLTINLITSSPETRNITHKEVINCTSPKYSNTNSCHRTTLNYTIKNCNIWFDGLSKDKLKCNRTKDGLSKVNLITDPGNHISSPLANPSINVNIKELSMDYAWDLEFLPNGSMLVSQQDGEIHYYKGSGNPIKIADIEVNFNKTVGLMGMAIDPQYRQNRFVYLFYTKPNYTLMKGKTPYVLSRISRFKIKNGQLTAEKVLIDDIRGATYHAGGRLEFGPDEKLYATTGSPGPFSNLMPQDPKTLVGKILRLNPDGTIPRKNPYNRSYVYSTGHRNPQGLAWHPETGYLYESEHGNNRYDEVNKIVKGGNYGWKAQKCSKDYIVKGPDKHVEEKGEAIEPLKCFNNWTMAPSGMTFVDKKSHPWYGDLFIAGLRGNHLHRLDINSGELHKDDIFYFIKKVNSSVATRRLRDVEFHRNSLWVVEDISGSLIKITSD